MDGIPHGIHPRYFVGEEFQEIQNTGDGNNPRVAEDLKGLVLRRQRDPVKMNGESGNENSQIEIDTGKRGETERDSKQVQLLHEKNIVRGELLSHAGFRHNQMTKLA
jgi:hypothetical protein